MTNDGSYATYLFNFGGHADWKGRITGIRVDPATNGNGEPVGIKWVSVTPNVVITPDPTGSITVNATLNGQPWSGPVNYSVVGPNRVIIGNAVPGTTNNLPLGQYTLSYDSGGPDGLAGITPSATRTLAADAAMTFTMNFGGQGGGFDELGPNLNITSHSDGQTVATSSVTISGTASDSGRGDSGIASVVVNGVRAGGDTAAGPDTALWSRTVALSPGANTITVAATDNSSPPNQTSQTITINLSGGGGGGGTVIATGLSNPNSVVTDGAEVFWTDYGSSSVKKVSVSGGPVTTLAGSVNSPSGVGVDGGYVYFGSDLGLKKVSKGGGPAVSLAGGPVTRLVVDGVNVYWTNYSAGTVQKVSVNGGAVTTLASGLTSPMGIALAGSNVCWSQFSHPGAIRCVGVNGGQVSVLANNSNAPGIAADAANVYWAENLFINSGKVNKVPAAGGAPVSLATGLNSPWDVALDGASAFWVEDSTSGAVKQVSLGGGTPVVLASGLAEPVGLAVDSTSVYWIERAGGGQGAGVLKKVGKGAAAGAPPGFVPLDFSWRFKNSMPQGRSGSAVAVYNNQMYVIGGDLRSNHYRYDPAADSWSALAPVPGEGIYEGGAAVVGNKIYAFGNWSDARVRIYDPASNSWSTGASAAAQPVRGASVVEYGGKVYVIGGADMSLHSSDAVRVYDPATDTWTSGASMPTARSYASAAVVNGLIYVIGGRGNTQPQIKSTVEVYDPAGDTWATRNAAPAGSYLAAFAALNDRIYIIGGGDGITSLSAVSEYDPATDSWRGLSRIQTSRYFAVAGAVNNRVYVVGGGDAGNGLSSVEEGVPTGAAPALLVSPDSLKVFANQYSPITFTISAAQNTDTALGITSSNDTVASVPSYLTIPAGSTSATTLVFGRTAGGPVTIRAKLPPSLANMSDDAEVTVVGRKPDVTTGDAGAVSSTGAVLAGSVGPNGLATNAWFEYGADSTFTTYYSTPPQLVGADAGAVNVEESISGLPPGTLHYFRAVGSNNVGTVRGAVRSFSTAAGGALRIDAVTPRAGRASGGQQVRLTGAFSGLSTPDQRRQREGDEVRV